MKDFAFKTKAYILATILTGLGVIVWNGFHAGTLNFGLLAVLSLLGSLSLIFKVVGATQRSHYNISFLIYSFTFVILGVPSTIIVIIVSNVVEWVYHKYPWYIQSFNITSYIIIIQLSGMLYQAINPTGQLLSFISLLAVLISLGLFTVLNHVMIGVVVLLARGENFARSGVLDVFPLLLDFSLLSIGATSAFLWTLNPFATLLSLIPLYLIYTTLKVPALERKSNMDAKTGLYNSEYFNSAFASELARANRYDHPLTVVMGDLDLLRNINNTYGHLAGDIVLIGIANIIKDSVSEYDVVARFGGEEYAILMPETTVLQAYQLVEQIRAQIASALFTVTTSVTPIQATMSFGIAGRVSGANLTPSEILHNADVALYHAKLTGRNRAVIYAEEGQNPFTTAGRAGRRVNQQIPPPENAVPQPEPPSLPAPPPQQRSAADEPPTQVPPKQMKSYPSWTINTYIGGLVSLATALFWLLYHPAPMDWNGLIYFCLLVIITEFLSVDIYVRDTSVSTSAAPMLAGFLMFGTTGVLILSITFAIVALIKHQSHLNRFFFNTSNQVIAGMLAVMIVSASGETYVHLSPLVQLILTVTAASIVFLSTSFLVSVVIHFTSCVPVSKVWAEKFGWLLPYYLILGVVSFSLFFSYMTMGVFGLFTILVPLLMLRYSQAQYLNRTRVMVVELQEKNTSLENSARVINKLNDDLLNALAEAIELRDPFALGHSKHVALYATLISEEMGLPIEKIEIIRKAGLLHDVGKLGVPESILFKPFALTREEYRIVKRHAELGVEIVKNCTSLQNLLPIIRHHHEHYDGSGYPGQLKGDNIPLEARIIAVADAIEAMASDRPYRKALTLQEISLELKKYTGIQFDPQVVAAFTRLVEKRGDAIVVNSAKVLVAAAVTGDQTRA